MSETPRTDRAWVDDTSADPASAALQMRDIARALERDLQAEQAAHNDLKAHYAKSIASVAELLDKNEIMVSENDGLRREMESESRCTDRDLFEMTKAALTGLLANSVRTGDEPRLYGQAAIIYARATLAELKKG